jgi:hypothetical protein
MNNTLELIKRIGPDGTKDILDAWLDRQRYQIAHRKDGHADRPIASFIQYIDDLLFSDYNRQLWQSIQTLEAPLAYQFQGQYSKLLATIK